MGIRMPTVCTPRQGTIQRPRPCGKVESVCPIRPMKRDQWVWATVSRVARYWLRVRLNAWPNGADCDIETPKQFSPQRTRRSTEEKNLSLDRWCLWDPFCPLCYLP